MTETVTAPFTFENPVFRAYAIAASLMVLKMFAMAWLTVYRMMRVNGGYRSPEDTRRSLLNPNPSPTQTEPNDYVERIRRIHHNDLENVPAFLAAGLVFVATAPSAALASGLFYGYVASRVAHFAAYVTARSHETRATFWTIGAAIVMYMAAASLAHALRG